MQNKCRKSAAKGLKKKLRIIGGILIFLNVYLLLSFFFSGMGFFKAVKMRKGRAVIQEEIRALRKENTQLVRQIGDLKNDPLTIEGLARDRLGLAKEGELIYEFFPESKPW
ncbi:MAG: septum formation initiator family protein [Nitrospiria bacterium]